LDVSEQRQAVPGGTLRTRPGSRFPPGATVLSGGVNFCVFSRDATQVELLLYAAADARGAFQIIPLSPEHNRTFFFWHVFVERLPVGTGHRSGLT
jgi:glycogen operon protein